jgi:8-hydroxy-5-deazaflavin:NADPH oxidoreductase
MRIGVLGTGTVGHTLAGRLVELGHEVTMGSRHAGNPRATSWAAAAGAAAQAGSFSDAADFGELLINATSGAASVDAFGAARPEALDGKVVLDVGNILIPNPEGGLPLVGATSTDSLGERLQRAFPAARIVKTLNTVTADVMVDPSLVSGDHVVFVCGEDPEAKQVAVELLGQFGWPASRVLDLGGIAASRAVEMYVALWVQLWGVAGSALFNIELVRGTSS